MASRSPPRSRLRIYLDLLRSVELEGGKARFSHVLSAANVPYERFLGYLAELEERGLVIEERGEDGNYLILTDKGRELLRELKRMEYFLKGFGFSL
ncbi:MAG: winged helix-turn-helix domain-containing protein [Acidilobus sp.]